MSLRRTLPAREGGDAYAVQRMQRAYPATSIHKGG